MCLGTCNAQLVTCNLQRVAYLEEEELVDVIGAHDLVGELDQLAEGQRAVQPDRKPAARAATPSLVAREVSR